MVAAAPLPDLPPRTEGESRVLLGGVPWSTYVVLRDTVDSPGLKLTYLEGWLEIMSPSRAHEVSKKQIARLLELFCLERDIPLFGYGSTTFRKEEKQRGLEPAECYCRGADREVPDVALEVIVSTPLLDKLEVYRGLGVREVWLFRGETFELVTLRHDQYEPIERSQVFPEVDLPVLARFALLEDQHAALKAFRDELRQRP
ncbi:MAG TPA: Uma2 family endonuclease [Polyangiaceae bacterium]|nr:Uma2 family endonuclease [Polyangiaceae bacterium]